MEGKVSAPISKSTVQVRQDQSEKSPGVHQTTTKNGHKLDKESQLGALFNARTNAVIKIKAFFQSIGSSKSMAEIKTELKAEVKTKFLDRFDKKEKAEMNDEGVRLLQLPGLTTAQRKDKFPFEVNKKAFQENTKLMLSVQIGTFIEEAKLAGARTETEIRSHVTEKLERLTKNSLSGEVAMGFQRDKFMEAKDEFQKEGRSLKSDIVHSFIMTMDELMTKSGSLENYGAKAKTNIEDQCKKVATNPRAADSFLRGKEDRPGSLILFAHGMKDVAKHIQTQLHDISQTPGLSDIGQRIQLKSEYFKPEHVAHLKNGALKVLDVLKNVEVPDDLKSKLSDQAQVIKDKVAKNELSAEQGKQLVHKLYLNAVLLRGVNPVLFNEAVNNPDRSSLSLLSQFIQGIANGGGGSKAFTNKDSARAFDQVAGGLENKFNQMLVDKFGMPDDVFKVKPELDLPPQVENNPQQEEPPSFEQYLAMQRQPPGNDPVNGQVNDPGKEDKLPDDK